jgi:hypothetical protein
MPDADLDDGSLTFLERLRATGVLDGQDWTNIAQWTVEARAYLAQPDQTVTKGKDGRTILDLDADPRNADWLRIVRVRRLTGAEVPGWAALWLWRLGHDRKPAFWSRVAAALKRP